MDFFTIEIGGLKRNLPIVPIGRNIKVASFNLLGDSELVLAIAQKLALNLKKIGFDYLVGPEVKVVPLLQELSRLLKAPRYIVCRKNIHGYMVSPIILKGKTDLVLNGPDATLLKNKKVVIVDDVISSGSTVEKTKKLIEKAGGKVVGVVCVFKQNSENFEIEDLIFLGELPLFKP